jgi:hypothetical protein
MNFQRRGEVASQYATGSPMRKRISVVRAARRSESATAFQSMLHSLGMKKP